MRVLVLGLLYLPETIGTGPYTADLAEYLNEQGHQVKVVTSFPNLPHWRIWDKYRGKWFQHEVINGVSVQRTFIFIPKKMGRSVSRILYDTSFAFSALIGGLFAGKCDVVVVISTPLQLGLTGWLISRFYKAKLFFHIQDLVPDIAVATGMLSEESLSVKIAHAMEQFIYKRSHGIGVICDGFVRNLISKNVPEEKIALLTNYIDLDFIHPVERNNNFRKEHGITPDKFVVMYSGTISLKQGLQTLVEAAAYLKDYPDIIFYLIGEGPYQAELQKQATELKLQNFRFLPLQPREGLASQLGAADLLVITQRKSITDMVFPGKLLYYSAVGCPILAAVSPNSETGRFINENKIGAVVPPEEPIELAKVILKLYCEGSGQLGQNGRKVAEKWFDKRTNLAKFVSQLELLSNNLTSA